MKKSFFKKGMSAFLALLMCFSALIGMGTTTAFAAEAGETDTVVMMSFPVKVTQTTVETGVILSFTI